LSHVPLEQCSYAPLLYQFSGHLRKPYRYLLTALVRGSVTR
jgi:hypothetical protein